jgi:hypothetical protein
MRLPARGLCSDPNNRYSPRLPPHLLQHFIDDAPVNELIQIGESFAWGQPRSGVVRDSNRSLIRFGGILGLYLNHHIAFVIDDILSAGCGPIR